MEELRSLSSHIVLLTDPGAGHLIPAAALAKPLLNNHNFSITLIAHSTVLSSQSQLSILNSLPVKIEVIFLPQVPPELIPKGSNSQAVCFLTVSHNLPHLRHTLISLSSTHPRMALVVDIYGILAFDVAAEVGVPTYLFFPSTCMALSLGLYLPELDAATKGEFRDLPEPVKVPGCTPFHGRDLPEPCHDRDSMSYKGFLHSFKTYCCLKGILVNSFEELEPGAIKALKEDKNVPPIYPIGPLVWSGTLSSERRARCLKWLDEQPDGSVVYVSFGSGGTLTRQQMKELALGLETSGQRFLWVVKSPHESEPSADYFGPVDNIGLDPNELLPEGFVERTEGVGCVVPAWAPQAEVLRHGATGGFVSHCGWNSALESVVSGVPMVAWPLYAEQKMNAVLLAEELGVAVRVDGAAGEDGVVGREEIARVVRSVMEGEEGKRLRGRVKEIKHAAMAAFGEGGSSSRAVHEIAREWKNL